ncbi:hypothetical protein OIU84_001381 [Salix udensis]|uniref:Calnexin homolog n=1 Tax=Salix udensis TaxID=889485 RepID=A0AAD6K6P5_9ROSI|nr:hypothetical protein OIU84_001381 [Salix udensis]
MREARRVTLRVAIVFLLAFVSFNQLFADDDTILYETFEESFSGRWIVSEKEDYKGEWKHEKSKGHDDYGLLVSEPAKKYAIVKELDEPVSLKDGIVLQFETRLQNGLECGGAYLKYLRPQDAGWVPKGFDSESPYSIMFGPDKCGTTNKVHFILKHKNPKSGEYVEHHLKFPPSVPHDKLTHVYTAILKSDNELQILVDGEEKKKEIPNPNYFELDQPDFEPIAAVGIEIWTMQDGILFDNVLIAKDEKFAASIRDTTWKPKFDAEKEKQKAEEAATTGTDGLVGFQKKVFELLYQVADISFLSEHKDKITDLIEKAEKQPNITIGVLVSIVVVILTLFFRIIFGGKKAKVVEKKPEPVVETSTTEGSSDEMKEETTEAESEGAAPARRRQPRREN